MNEAAGVQELGGEMGGELMASAIDFCGDSVRKGNVCGRSPARFMMVEEKH
jgi:hypothetical protein